jgi:hypothetical protein
MNEARSMGLLTGDAFVIALGRITASNRSPTAWEAGCLYAALCAMAVRDYRTAQCNVAWSALVDPTEPPPIRAIPIPTINELFAALANLEDSLDIDSWSCRRQPAP